MEKTIKAPKAKTAVKAAPKKASATPSTANRPLAHGIGRRKSSVARVWLKRGNGKVTVNGKAYRSYFDSDFVRDDAVFAFTVAPAAAKNHDIIANVKGGGMSSQAGAVRLGIARALVKADESLRVEMRKNGLLTVDSRLKERKKPGQPGARKKFQFVKR